VKLEEQISVISLFNAIASRIEGLTHGAQAMADGTVVAWAQIPPGKRKKVVFDGAGPDMRNDFFELVCAVMIDAINGGGGRASSRGGSPGI
jgi:hypothetical protein